MPVTDVTTDPQNLTMTLIADLAVPVERVWAALADSLCARRACHNRAGSSTLTPYGSTHRP